MDIAAFYMYPYRCLNLKVYNLHLNTYLHSLLYTTTIVCIISLFIGVTYHINNEYGLTLSSKLPQKTFAVAGTVTSASRPDSMNKNQSCSPSKCHFYILHVKFIFT